MSVRVGVIGVGRIGLPVCENLVRAGNTVIASDVLPERATHVRHAGASWDPETRTVAAAADVLITVLPGTAELRHAMIAATPALTEGTTWIDLTSTSPTVGAQFAEQLHERGIDCLDAPVGGGVAAARQGTLQLFVGGAAETVRRHRPLLETLGTIDHVGDHGAGYTTKLLVNLLWFGHALATAEALLLARGAGMDLERLRDALEHSAADSKFIRRDLDALLDGDYLRSFGLDRCSEELDAIADLAGDLGVPFELSTVVRNAYRRALERYGPVDGELLPVAMLEEESGLRLRRDP